MYNKHTYAVDKESRQLVFLSVFIFTLSSSVLEEPEQKRVLTNSSG